MRCLRDAALAWGGGIYVCAGCRQLCYRLHDRLCISARGQWLQVTFPAAASTSRFARLNSRDGGLGRTSEVLFRVIIF